MIDKTICFFDIESTGIEITKDRIIQLSLIKTGLDLIPIEKKKLLLSNCNVPIHPKAFEAHGINELDLVGCHPFYSYAPKIKTFIDDCDYIAGHNIKKFDIPLMMEEFARSGIEWIPKPSIDTYVIMSNKQPRTLEGALKFYCDKEIESAHDAEGDVLSTIDILRGQIKMYSFDQFIRLLQEEDENAKEEYQDLDSVLISQSKYKDEDKRLSFDGKIILNDEGKAVFNFGKFKDKELKEADLGYINFILGGDFPIQTKNVLRSLLNK